jgi:restriction endonuclease Mrr
VQSRRAAASNPAAAAMLSAALTDLARLRWETLSQLLMWAWEHLGYEVEPTDCGANGMVDFILTDHTGYTYVQARRWKQTAVTVSDLARLGQNMDLVGVQQGVWLTCGVVEPQARQWASASGIRVIEGQELAIMVDRIRNRPGPDRPGERSAPPSN